VKSRLRIVVLLIMVLVLVGAACGKRPKPDPKYVDPAANPSALPDMPANIDQKK
jgi:hypothetical protein